jgi:hypothetical protein
MRLAYFAVHLKAKRGFCAFGVWQDNQLKIQPIDGKAVLRRDAHLKIQASTCARSVCKSAHRSMWVWQVEPGELRFWNLWDLPTIAGCVHIWAGATQNLGSTSATSDMWFFCVTTQVLWCRAEDQIARGAQASRQAGQMHQCGGLRAAWLDLARLPCAAYTPSCKPWKFASTSA